MRWWSNKHLISLLVFFLLIQASYGQDINQTLNDTNQPQKNEISSSLATTTQNISIELSTNNLPVRETTVQVLENGTKKLDLYTDENGLAFFQADKSETYTFMIQSENYDNVTRNITIVPGINTIKFTLKSKKDSGFWLLFIPALIGFVTFLYWFIRFNHHSFLPYHRVDKIFYYSLLAVLTLSWPVILVYLFYKVQENILLGGLSFPIYIIIASLLGVISYLLLSIEEVFAQNIPKYKRNSIVWGYIRRITIAPYISILGVYVLLDAAKLQNIWFILLFSFIAGMFTKTIEDRLYSAVQGFLPEDKLKEFKERGLTYSIENSELVVRLKVDADVAYTLFENDIAEVDQLALFDIDRMNKCLERQKKCKKDKYLIKSITDIIYHRSVDERQNQINFELKCPDIKVIERITRDIEPEYLKKIITDANMQKDEIDKLKIVLDLTTSDMDLLINKAKAYSINEFANLDLDSIDWGMKTPTENKKITDLFKQKQKKAKSIASYELIFLEDLKKLHADLKDKTPEDYIEIVKLHIEIREKGISKWTVDDTENLVKDAKKYYDKKITTLDDLKTLCIKQGTDHVKEKLKDISVISVLIDKITDFKIPCS